MEGQTGDEEAYRFCLPCLMVVWQGYHFENEFSIQLQCALIQKLIVIPICCVNVLCIHSKE